MRVRKKHIPYFQALSLIQPRKKRKSKNFNRKSKKSCEAIALMADGLIIARTPDDDSCIPSGTLDLLDYKLENIEISAASDFRIVSLKNRSPMNYDETDDIFEHEAEISYIKAFDGNTQIAAGTSWVTLKRLGLTTTCYY